MITPNFSTFLCSRLSASTRSPRSVQQRRPFILFDDILFGLLQYDFFVDADLAEFVLDDRKAQAVIGSL